MIPTSAPATKVHGNTGRQAGRSLDLNGRLCLQEHFCLNDFTVFAEQPGIIVCPNGKELLPEPVDDPCELVFAAKPADCAACMFRHRCISDHHPARKVYVKGSQLGLLPGNLTTAKIIGTSPAIMEAKERLLECAAAAIRVLLMGETGTGKDLFARAIHQHSHRKGRFVAVNCGGIPQSLIESELFGYVKGAFTGATETKEGLFEAANSGTIFLDEIGDLSRDLQVKLLRVLQEKEVTRLGSTTPIPVDFRVICATHQDLETMVRNGTFREDLYYRITTFVITIPPLRARKEDVPIIASFLLAKYDRENGTSHDLSADAKTALKGYSFPGNVRALENVIARTATRAQERVLTAEHFNNLGRLATQNICTPHASEDKSTATPSACRTSPNLTSDPVRVVILNLTAQLEALLRNADEGGHPKILMPRNIPTLLFRLEHLIANSVLEIAKGKITVAEQIAELSRGVLRRRSRPDYELEREERHLRLRTQGEQMAAKRKKDRGNGSSQ
jgi:DNA-binding NtrC family response regulator